MAHLRKITKNGKAPGVPKLMFVLVPASVLLVLLLILLAEEAVSSRPAEVIAQATSVRPAQAVAVEPASTATTEIPIWADLATPDTILPTAMPTSPAPGVPPEPSPSVIPPTAAPIALAFPTEIPLPAVDPTETPQTTADPTAVPFVPADPPDSYAPIARLVIPGIGVNASVETKSLDPDGVMQTPSGPDVASWYDFSSQPVGEGNSVFAGHLDYAGYGPAVFWRLGDLQPGDVIEVRLQDGSALTYRVTSVQVFAATDDASNVVASTGRPTITLITCDGAFDSEGRAYDKRLVVQGDRVD